MKRILITVALLLGGCGFGARAQEEATITQCYEWARENYPQVRRFGLIDRTEQYSLSNAAKAWLPQVAIGAKASYQSDVTQLPFGDQLADIAPGLTIPVLSKDQYQVTAEVNQTIWDGGTIRSSRERAKAEASLSRKQLESDLYALNDRVNRLYFGCLLQEELLALNELLQKDLQVNLDRVVAMIANGVANASDRESLEVELLNARQQAIELKASRQAYGQMLAALTGKPLAEARLRVPSVAGGELPLVVNRPELHALEAQRHLLDTQERQLKAGLMPRLGAFVQGGYGRPGLDMLEDAFRPYYIAGVRLSWNLGKLYTWRNDRRKLDAGRRTVDLQRETFLFDTRLQMLHQQTEIRKLAELMRTDDRIVDLRTNLKRAAEVKLANGVISVADLVREIHAEEQARRTASLHRIQQLHSIYNYMYTINE